MPSEVYFKEGYGRRVRRIDPDETTGLAYIGGGLWSSLALPHQTIEVTPPGNLPLAGDGLLYAQLGMFFDGIPLVSAKNATVTYDIGDGPVHFVVELPDDTTAEDAASLIADAPDWPAELPALAVANNVRLTPDTGTTLHVFTVAI